MPEQLRVELFPADLDASVGYYTQQLGFGVERDDRPHGQRYVALARGGVRLGLLEAEGEPFPWMPAPSHVELVLEVDDIDAEWTRVRAIGVAIDRELVERPWGLRDFRVVDPDGYYWRITDR